MTLFEVIVSGKQKIKGDTVHYKEAINLSAVDSQYAQDWAAGIAEQIGVYEIKVESVKAI